MAYRTMTGAICAGAPCELVEFFDGQRLAVGFGGELLDTTTEIADLIQSVPGGQLQGEFAVNVGDRHGDVEEMFGRLRERDFVLNWVAGAPADAKQRKRKKNRAEGARLREKLMPRFSSG